VGHTGPVTGKQKKNILKETLEASRWQV